MWIFLKYFTSYIFQAKTRQRLLFLAILGIILSSFSLLSIQGIMGGLQGQLVKRWEKIHGKFNLVSSPQEKTTFEEVLKYLKKHKISFALEHQLEVLLENKTYFQPLVLHGVDLNYPLPGHLTKKDFSGIVLGSDVAEQLKVKFLDDLMIISPSHTDSMMGEVPRFSKVSLSDYHLSELYEIDSTEGWIDINKVHNLIRQKTFNRVRIYSDLSEVQLIELKRLAPSLTLLNWADEHKTLSFALNLETKMMLFLFISMGLLVAVAIISGWLIFYSKVTRDFLTFWILGMSKEKIFKNIYFFTIFLSLVSCVVGLILGGTFLSLLQDYGHQVMPDIFIERRFPVILSISDVIIALGIPLFISILFSYVAYKIFANTKFSFIQRVRGVS